MARPAMQTLMWHAEPQLAGSGKVRTQTGQSTGLSSKEDNNATRSRTLKSKWFTRKPQIRCGQLSRLFISTLFVSTT